MAEQAPGHALSELQSHILRYLVQRGATYARPVSSGELAQALCVSSTYAREQADQLVRVGRVQARRGKGGGYYLTDGRLPEELSRAVLQGVWE